MPRILLVIPTLSSYFAFLSDYADALIKRGYEVHVVTHLKLLQGGAVATRIDASKCIFHDIEIARGANLASALSAARKVRRVVETVSPTYIQAHFSAAAFVCALAHRSSWPRAESVIQGLASTLAPGFSKWAAWAGERLAIARLDTMWVLTQDDYEVACSWNPDKARLQQSPGFGCRIDQFDPARFSPEWRAERKRELAIDPDAKVLIFVGRLAAFKGFDRVVHTFQSLGDRVAKVHLLIVGGRDDLHSSGLSVAEWNALEQHSNVTLAGWQDDTAQWLALSDLCLFPSAREGMPVCLMEALSMGVPVVTTDSRGCRDVVTHEVDGLVLADGSVESMTQACALLFKDANRLQRYAEAALLGRAKWSRKHFIDEYMVEFEAVVSPAAID